MDGQKTPSLLFDSICLLAKWHPNLSNRLAWCTIVTDDRRNVLKVTM